MSRASYEKRAGAWSGFEVSVWAGSQPVCARYTDGVIWATVSREITPRGAVRWLVLFEGGARWCYVFQAAKARRLATEAAAWMPEQRRGACRRCTWRLMPCAASGRSCESAVQA